MQNDLIVYPDWAHIALPLVMLAIWLLIVALDAEPRKGGKR